MRSNLLSPTPTWAYLLGLVLLAQVALAVPFPSSTSGGSALARSTVKQPNSVDDGTLLDDVAHPSHHARTTKPESVDDGFFEPTSVDDGTILNVRRHPHEHQITSVDDGTLATTRHAHAHEPEHNAKPNSVDDGTLLKKLNSVDDGTIAQTRHAHPHEHQPKVKQSSVDDGTIVLISVDDGTFVTKRAREDSEDDGSASVKEVRAVHDVGADVGAARRVIATKARALGQVSAAARAVKSSSTVNSN